MYTIGKRMTIRVYNRVNQTTVIGNLKWEKKIVKWIKI